jgi:exonuclease SbcC
MEAAREAVAASLEKSNSLDAKAALAAEDIAAANREISAIDRERSSSILVPRSRLHERLNVIAKLLCLEGCPEEEVAQAAWAVAVIAMVDVERERLAERCEAAQSVWEDHQRRRLAVVAELDAEPSSALAAASTELRNAESALTSAQTALAHATELAERMKKLHPVKAGLVGLRECLGANGFPAYATQQRQLRLLEIGSIILSDMTDGRYRFTNDFSIFDRDVNDARSAHTLSGGEKFLASLALSLAVVEIASSAGAKIESLFLDEGFASLDAETLEIAMLELRKRTRAGRTICVISHLSQVTQFVTDTLLVEAKDEGSTVSRIAGPVDEDSDVVEGLVNQLALR